MDNKILMKLYYVFDEKNEYRSGHLVQESPLEKGVHLQPVNSTDIAPNLVTGMASVWEGDKWVNYDDHRGVIFDIVTGSSVDLTELGPIPDGFTDQPYLGDNFVFDGVAWVLSKTAQNKINREVKHASKVDAVSNIVVEADGFQFDGSVASQTAMILAMASDVGPFDWILADNTVVNIPQTTLSKALKKSNKEFQRIWVNGGV